MKRSILLCALFVICSSAAFAQEDKVTQGVVTTTTNTTYTTVTQTKQVRMSREQWKEQKRIEREELRSIRKDTAYIQKFANEKKWGVGLRIGGMSVVNVVGNYKVTKRSYAELRFGLCYNYTTLEDVNNRACVDFTALYNWRIVNAELTPYVGWFVDTGLGVNVGGNVRLRYLGAALMARIGIHFYKVPMTLSFDYTPSIGYIDNRLRSGRLLDHKFNDFGVINFGITCAYNF